jgi:hypothetical protein
LYGVSLGTGLINNKFGATLNVERKIAEGTRKSGRYEGTNYYTSISYLPGSQHSLRLILHGAPQLHGYSWSGDILYFKKFGYKANPAPFLPKNVVNQVGPNKTTGAQNYGLTDDSRELQDDNFVNLSHNFYHKPQGELHYTYEISPITSLNSTFFYSLGRGGGSSITGNGTMFSYSRTRFGNNGFTYDTLNTNLYGADGYIADTSAANLYLKNAAQRISYSLHRQFGLLASVQTKINKDFNITAGGEFRSWKADHPGHFNNLFGKSTFTQSYGYIDTVGKPPKSFSRVVTQGDLNGPTGDVGNIFGWELATDPTYKTQYRNYIGETPQFTLFAQGNYQINALNIMGSIQYVWYKYKLTENMPSENAIGTPVTTTDTTEGVRSDGLFYIHGTNNKMYAFTLVNAERSRGFLQPKIGLNYNITSSLNVFGNFAHVERFVDLSIYYNQGRVNPNANDEKSNQFELGFGWSDQNIFLKLNGYYMDWQNKSTRITDVSKAGEPGYDRNGNISLLVGTSRHMGVELQFDANLDKLLPFRGVKFSGSMTYMDNQWLSVLDEVKTINGKRNVFNSSARDMNGNIDTLFFDELAGTKLASGPQFMFNLGLDYKYKEFFSGLDFNFFARNFLLDGGTYTAVTSEYVGKTSSGKEIYKSTYDNQLPVAGTLDFYAGYNYQFSKWFRGALSVQVFNIFNTEYFAASDRSGLIPGMLRTYRMNLSLGL